MANVEIVKVEDASLAADLNLFFDLPVKAYASIQDGVYTSAYGLAWAEGRCWLWFKSIEPCKLPAIQVVRHAKKLLLWAKNMGEKEVFTPRDDEYSTSERLLAIVGFEYRGLEAGKEIYSWRV
jgi:hypothetical protein